MTNAGRSQSTGFSNKENIEQLNSFLRGELSAVETFGQAIEKLEDEPSVVRELDACRRSHADRASLLRSEILALGGTPAADSGAWGSFAKLVEGGAAVFGKKAALNALEEGEDHGRDDYRRDLSNLSPAVQSFVRAHLLPEQLRTHDIVSGLTKAV